MSLIFSKDDLYIKKNTIYFIHRIASDTTYWNDKNVGRNGSKADLQKLLKLDPEYNIDIRDDRGATALHEACINGKEALFDELLKCGADIEARDNDNKTPIFYAAQGRTSILKKLVSLGAKVDHIDSFRYLPITEACITGRVQNVKFLCQQKIDKDLVETSGRSLISHLVHSTGGMEDPTRIAVSAGGMNASNLQLLIRAIVKTGIRFNHKDLDTGKNEVFHLGERIANDYSRRRSSDYIAMMKTLINVGSNPWEKDKAGNSTFHFLNKEEIEQLKPTLKRFIKGAEIKILSKVHTVNELKAFFFNQSKYSKDEVYDMLEDGCPAKQFFQKALELPPISIDA